MTASGYSRVLPSRRLNGAIDDAPELTHVEILWIKKRVENRIRFGRTDQQHMINRRWSVVSFTAGSVFAFLRWASGTYGTVESRIDILRAVAIGEHFVTIPEVRPGGESLLRTSGWPRVEKVLQTIEAVEALRINPADVAHDYWRHVHNRLSVGDRPQPLHTNPTSRLAVSEAGDVMTGRSAVLMATAMAVAAIATTADSGTAPLVIWNASGSVPIGLYRVRPARDVTVTTLVLAYPPEPLATWLAEGGYLPRGVPLLKPVLALAGQTVCRLGAVITVDGRERGAAREQDHSGRPLPVWQGCRVIGDGEIFLMNPDEPTSLDGRYFGPLPIAAIAGRAEQLVTFGENRSAGFDASPMPVSGGPARVPARPA
jgi:conjugative transfer signal peptidase TraF